MDQNSKNLFYSDSNDSNDQAQVSQADLNGLVSPEPIAIIGIGCRFPGEANDPTSFWELLRKGVDAITEIPAERWNSSRFYHPDSVTPPGKVRTRWGGFVDTIAQFDPVFFGISPREAKRMDPQQRLLLEVAWEALEDGGQVQEQLAGTNVGVFIGIASYDYAEIQHSVNDRQFIDAHTNTGVALSIAANRISYVFDFKGPSLAVDTACSSSLVATHLACRSLQSGECSLALAGGVNAILKPEPTIGFSQASMLSPDGRCKAFDARANGYTRSEGAGVIVLKRLSSAIQDGDPIYAVILSSAVNQDGRTNGMTVPGRSAQEAILREVYRQARVKPGYIQYVEAHGTGTPVGDPIEAEALGTVLSADRPLDSDCMIGTVKTNIGHLEAAAGIAGLIKTAISLQQQMIPPNLHFQQPNPNIPFSELRLSVPQTLLPWPQNGAPARAGVNSFGFGGTNAHVLLEEAPRSPDKAPQEQAYPADHVYILPLSARSPEALRDYGRAYRDFLAEPEHDNSTTLSIHDVCYTASMRRNHHNYRSAMVGGSRVEFSNRLDVFLDDAFVDGKSRIRLPVGRQTIGQSSKLVFVFSGMGPQWWAMGRQLLTQEPIFRQAIEQCDALLRQHANWSLLEELVTDESRSRMGETQIAQPANFAIQVALAALWRTWGIEPDAIVGHSTGEVAAAYVAGALNLETAVRVIYHRSRLQQKVSGRGKMMAVDLSAQAMESLLVGYQEQVSTAAINSPTSVTLSGDAAALAQIAQTLEEQQLFCQTLRVEVPYHSHEMETIREELIQSLQGIQIQPTRVPLYSTVTGTLNRGEKLDAEYWWHNVRNTVYFAKAIEELRGEGFDTFLELSPHPVLASAIADCFFAKGSKGTVLPSIRRYEAERLLMLQSLGELYTRGYTVNWNAFYPDGGRCVRLPTYPWQHERFWQESDESLQKRLKQLVHPLLGRRLNSAYPTWEIELDKQLLPYMNDHKVQGTVVYPGAAYVETFLAVAEEMLSAGAYTVEEVKFHKALFLPDSDLSMLQVCFDVRDSIVNIYSHTDASKGGWTLHATGRLGKNNGRDRQVKLAQIRKRCVNDISEICYLYFKEHGLEYGPFFQGVKRLYRANEEAIGQIQLNDVLASTMHEYIIHPALLDACFQVLIGTIIAEDTEAASRNRTYLPVGIERITIYERPKSSLWSYAQLVAQNADFLEGNIDLLDDDGHVMVEIRGFRCQALAGEQIDDSDSLGDQFYKFQWEAQTDPESAATHRSVTYLPSPGQITESIQTRATQFGEQFGFERYYSEVEPQLNQMCVTYILVALQQLGWEINPGQRFTSAALMEHLVVAPQHHRLLERMLMILVEATVLKKSGAEWEIVGKPQVLSSRESLNSLLAQYPEYSAELDLLGQCGPRLADVLQEKIDPLQIIFPNGSFALTERVYQQSRSYQVYNLLIEQALRTIVRALPAEGTIRILEIGAGTGGTTSYLLPILPANRTDYVFTDVSQLFLSKARAKFQGYQFIRYQLLDIEADPQIQELECHSFDLILASDALHATCDLRQTLAHVKQLLASEGILILLELTNPPYWFDLVFGMLRGWWVFTDEDLRPSHPCLPRQAWQELLSESGFTEVSTISDMKQSERSLHSVILTQGPRIEPEEPVVETISALEKRRSWIILADTQGVGQMLAKYLRERNQEPIIVYPANAFNCVDHQHFQICPEQQDDFQKLLDVVGLEHSTCLGVVHLWSLDAASSEEIRFDSLDTAQTLGCISALHLVQALVHTGWADLPRLWLVTQRAQAVGIDVGSVEIAQAPLWGLGRVIINEHPELRCTMVDIGHTDNTHEIERLLDEFWTDDGEAEIALRENRRYVHRLNSVSIDAIELATQRRIKVEENQPFQLETFKPGMLDNLILREVSRKAPRPGEVEIQVHAAGLNFRDIMKAMGVYPTEGGEEQWLGDECSGTIIAIGDSVSEFKIGDEVIGIVPDSFSAYVTVSTTFVVPKPAHLSFEEAATIPIVFLTAYYALYYLGRIRQGERVLIHSASGGVGLAAIQLAKQVGAEIFVTAGNPEKREFLRSIGVKYIMDSRSLDFAREIMDITEGKGVDIVLNSLSGDAISTSFSLLRPYGRFLEIGKTDIYQNSKLGLGPFRKNLSFFAIDLGRLFQERPIMVGELLREVIQSFADEMLQPLPYRVFPISQSADAFRYMAQAKHIGKIVLSLKDRDAFMLPLTRQVIPFRSYGTYLISGGLGGFGLAVAQWMVEQGARHLVLMGRNGASSPTAKQVVAEMQNAGAEIIVVRANVVDEEQVARVVGDINRTTHPLCGVLHAAMVLDDDFLLQLDKVRFNTVMEPKMKGAWNLHRQTLLYSLDFFICFSSFATLIGNSGQGNYAAANAFLDALANHRRAHGLPALSINWGAIAEVGYIASHSEISVHFERQGLTAFTPKQATSILAQLLQTNAVQVGVLDMDWQTWGKYSPEISRSPRYSHLFQAATQSQLYVNSQTEKEKSFLSAILSTQEESRQQVLEAQLSEKLAMVLGSSASRIDVQQSLSNLGLDSLMAVELRYVLENELGIKVPIMALMQTSSITGLAKQILDQLVE